MAKISRNILIPIAVLVLITTVLLLTANQAYTSGITSEKLHTSTAQDISQNPQISQLTSITEIPDVSPEDYYYEVLREIVENYKLDVTLPDGTFRGNQLATRGQFVKWLANGLNVVREQILSSGGDPTVLVDNLEQISAVLIQDNLSWEAELAQIQVRLEELERRIR
ncbi:MAG: hypothetical protein F6K14_09470 [Symploca sp. SIO2C1]|nr:hypothetical protein [Symploca sp. SIO2C1]